METTLSDVVQGVYKRLGQLRISKVTGGDDSTIIDSTIDGAGNGDYKNGAVFVIRTSDGAAPQGEFGRVNAFSGTDKKFTIDGAFTDSVEAGDVYGYTGPQYPLQQVIEFVNFGIQRIGLIPLVDTSLYSDSDKTEYSALVDWAKPEPKRIDIQTYKADDNNLWMPIIDWEYIPALPGEDGKIMFKNGLPEGYNIRVWYMDSHPIVSEYDDVILNAIHPNLAIAGALLESLEWNASRTQGNEFVLQQLNNAKDTFNDASNKHRIPKIPARVKLFGAY